MLWFLLDVKIIIFFLIRYQFHMILAIEINIGKNMKMLFSFEKIVALLQGKI